MVRLIALIISIVLQILAASIALRFMKLTKYRISWILLSLSFAFMAVRKIIQFFEYFRGAPSYTWQIIDDWLGCFHLIHDNSWRNPDPGIILFS